MLPALKVACGCNERGAKPGVSLPHWVKTSNRVASPFAGTLK